MKRHLLITLLILFAPMILMAQAIEFSGYGGYMLSGKARYYDGEIDVKDGPVWGLTLGYDMGTGTLVQFIYNNTATDSETVSYGLLGGYQEFDLKIEHFHLGVEKAIAGNDMVRPYGAFSMGLTSYAPQTRNFDTVVRFSMGLGAGVKIFVTDQIGFKFQGRMFVPLVFDGAGIYCSSGSGCGGGSSFQVPIMHGEFSGGVVFRMEK